MPKTISPLFSIAWKDSRGSRWRLFLFSSGLFLGIAILVFSLSVRDEIENILDRGAMAILGADASIKSKDPVPENLIGKPELDLSLKEVRLRSMVVFEDGNTRLTQIRASQNGFPFYGEVQTQPPSSWQKLRAGQNLALVDQSLLLASGAKIGEKLKIGKSEFLIIAAVTRSPGVSLFNSAVAPRIYINYDDVEATGLLSRYSVVDHFLYLKLNPKTAEAVLTRLSTKLPSGINLETAKQRQEGLASINDNFLVYLSLVGLSCLILGALGAASSVFFYLQGKIKDAAVFKCLGYRGSEVATIYFVQLFVVAVISSIAGSLCGALIFYFCLPYLSAFFSSTLQFSFPINSIISGVCVGSGTLIVAVMPGIFILKKTPALVLLREGVKPVLSWQEKAVLFIISFFIAPLFLLLIASPFKAFVYGIILNLILALLFVLSHAAKRISISATRLRMPFVIRYGLAALGRPGNSTTAVINAFSLSIILAATLFITQHFIKAQVLATKDEKVANLFMYDLAPEQANDLRQVLDAKAIKIAEEVPIVLMRIVRINGTEVSKLLREEGSKIPPWTLKREYWTSYRSELLKNEEITEGQWIGKHAYSGNSPIPISLDASLARKLSVSLGDTLDFDIQGVNFVTKITSLRKIHWEQMQRNAFVVFPAGVLEDAPKFIFITAYVPDPQDSAELQKTLVERFPGISVLDIRFVADTLVPMLEKIGRGISVLAALVLLTALTILISALIGSKDSRRKELGLLRILGASRVQTRKIGLIEYVILAIISAVIALGVSLSLAYALSVFVLELNFLIPWKGLLILVCCSVLLVSVISFLIDSAKSFNRIDF